MQNAQQNLHAMKVNNGIDLSTALAKGVFLLSARRASLCRHHAGVIIEQSMPYKNAREIINVDYTLSDILGSAVN